jgi:hypothetical protein
MARRIFLLLIFVVFIPSAGFGQVVLLQMTASELQDTRAFERDPNKVVLVVKSLIANLSFASNFSEIKVKKLEPGLWHLVLEPEPQIITFSAPGFQRLQKRIFISKAEKAKEIEIRIDQESFRIAGQVDRDPPQIIHNPVFQANEADSIRFFARVTDNTGVSEVKLFHRLRGTSDYDSTTMANISGDIYQAFLVASDTSLEYYLTATDIFANPPGFSRGPDDPYIVTVTPKQPQVVEREEVPEQQTGQIPTLKAPKKGGKLWLWLGLGALALGGGALALSGGSGNGGGTVIPPVTGDPKLPNPPGDPGGN